MYVLVMIVNFGDGKEWGKESGAEGGGAGAGRGGRAVAAGALQLSPPALDFGRAALATAHALTVTLTNTANTTMHLASVAGTTPDFHASFFESKVYSTITLAPQTVCRHVSRTTNSPRRGSLTSHHFLTHKPTKPTTPAPPPPNTHPQTNPTLPNKPNQHTPSTPTQTTNPP
ncbi:hypothetical protein SFRURICE_000174 [Spodoptera frugiperda]|nr:hypothetical protein SFRURICE_000174 [Spodoptera frugiperda]